VNQQAVPVRGEVPVCRNQRLRRGTLEKRTRFRIDRLAEEVVRAGVADIEPDGGIELDELDEVCRAASLRILWRPVCA
jgi:hypothetical protein